LLKYLDKNLTKIIGDYKRDKQGHPCFGKVIVINI